MTPTTPPPASHDTADRLLSDFFKNELPHPWPGPPALAAAGPARRAVSDPGGRSRYTLAASVAALLGLGVYLSSGGPTGPAPQAQPGLMNGAQMDGKRLLDPKNPNPKPVEHDPMLGANMP